MAKLRQIEVRRYRGARLVIIDDGGSGWLVRVYSPDDPAPRALRDPAPNALGSLLARAEGLVDELLLGPAEIGGH
jgi:hypothetical protein